MINKAFELDKTVISKQRTMDNYPNAKQNNTTGFNHCLAINFIYRLLSLCYRHSQLTSIRKNYFSWNYSEKLLRLNYIFNMISLIRHHASISFIDFRFYFAHFMDKNSSTNSNKFLTARIWTSSDKM